VHGFLALYALRVELDDAANGVGYRTYGEPMRRLDPPRLVAVRPDGHWCDGEQRAWRRDVDGWLGYVCYSESPGVRWLEWLDAERVREA
jgi:hypothetical protein